MLKFNKRAMMKTDILYAAFVSLGIFVSCTNDDAAIPSLPDEGENRIVKTSITKYEGFGQILETENNITDIQACIFEGGKMSRIYNTLTSSEDSFDIQIERHAGTLYVLANTKEQINLDELKSQGITEEEWLKKCMTMKDNTPVHFYSGSLSLNDISNSQSVFPVNLKRGFARFDLNLKTAGAASVNSITLKNAAQSGALFTARSEYSPNEVPANDMTVSFDLPLTTDTTAVFYAYEQAKENLEISVDVIIDGKPHTLTKALNEDIKRNTIYTITVRKDVIDKEVQLTIEEWKDGGDTALKPGIDDRLAIDSSLTEIPHNVTVAHEGTMLILPHLETDFIVAIKSDSELEVLPVTDCSLTVEPVSIEELKNKRATSFVGINLFRIHKKLYSPNMKTADLKVYFHRKGLNNSYPEDNLQIRMTGNPTTSEGVLEFGIDTYTYDFNRYIDNEFGIFTLPSDKEMTVEFEEGEDPWIKIDAESGNNVYRVLGGWRPNDPTANGRKQAATLVIKNKTDGSDREEYTVIRRNYGLPVTWLHGVWWCKYNAIKNSRDFGDQILSSSDPAAQSGMTVFQYLTSCAQEDFFNLWGWAYQGDSGQGMKVIEKDSVIVLDGFTREEKVHINKLPPKTLSPDGYELPSMEEFNRLFDATDYIWMMYNGTHTLKNPWNGYSKVKRQQLRKNDIQIGSITISDIIYIAMTSPDFPEYEPLVWYGPAAQWNDSGILHSGHYNNILFGVYSSTGEGWYMNGGMSNLYMMKNGASSYDTRILRFKKSDVEYIY